MCDTTQPTKRSDEPSIFDMELDPPRKREKLYTSSSPPTLSPPSQSSLTALLSLGGDKNNKNHTPTTTNITTSPLDEDYNTTCRQMDVFKISNICNNNDNNTTNTTNNYESYNGNNDGLDDDDMLAKALAMSLDPTNDNSNNDNSTKDIYYCKKIKYADGKMYPIVLQNENGPCPLLAICNALLLRGAIKMDLSTSFVSVDEINSLINNYMLEKLDKTKNSGLYSEMVRTNFERNVNDAIDILPKLKRGLDVNLKFSGVLDFEFTAELVILDSVDLTLFHGWLPDPNNADDKKAIAVMKKLGLSSYNQLVDWIVTSQDEPTMSSQTSSETEEEKKKKAAIKEEEKNILLEFLTTHGGVQVTKYGLDQIRDTLALQKPCGVSVDRRADVGLGLGDGPHVMFSNNHFYTLLYREGHLYVLLTDMGFLYEDVVWERLDKIGGADNVFCFNDFSVLIHEDTESSKIDVDVEDYGKAKPIGIRTSGSLPIPAAASSSLVTTMSPSPSPSPRRPGVYNASPYSRFGGIVSPVSPQNLSVLRNRSYSRSPPGSYNSRYNVTSSPSPQKYDIRNNYYNYNHRNNLPSPSPKTPPMSFYHSSPSRHNMTTYANSPSPSSSYSSSSLRHNYYGVSPKTEMNTSFEVMSVLKTYFFSRYFTAPENVTLDTVLDDICKSEYEVRDLWSYMARRMHIDIPLAQQNNVTTVSEFISVILSLNK